MLREHNGEARVIWEEGGTSLSMVPIFNLSNDFFTFCNSDRWMPEVLEKYRPGDVLVVKGDVFWDCNFVMQSSQSGGMFMGYRAFQIYVRDLYMDMYGKDNTDETIKRAE